MSSIEELKYLREREDHVEFKAAAHNYPFAGGNRTDPRDRRRCVLGYVVALANEKGGRLVLGMADARPHQLTGSDFAAGECGQLEDEIYSRLHIRVRTEELFEGQKRVLVINVPSRPIGKALRFEGVPLMRIGESLREMDDAEYWSILQEQDPDFTSHDCPEIGLEDLDSNAVEKLRALVVKKRARMDASTMPLNLLLKELDLINENGTLSYATLVLLGNKEWIDRLLPQTNVIVEYRLNHSQTRYTARKEFRGALLIVLDDVWEYLNQPASNPLCHVNDLPQILDVRAFNEETVREGIMNAMIHRSFQSPSDILVRQYPDKIEIINGGGFPYGVNVGNILTVSSSPRNRRLAEAIEKTGLIERSGQGVDLMFANQVREGKPLPDYEGSDDYQVQLNIPGKVEENMFFLLVHDLVYHENADEWMNTFDWLALHFVWEGKSDLALSESLRKLEEKGIIVRNKTYGYVMGNPYFSRISSVKFGVVPAEVIRDIFYVVKQYREAAMPQFVEALEGVMTQKQVRVIIEKLCDAGVLIRRGKSRASRYVWGVDGFSI